MKFRDKNILATFVFYFILVISAIINYFVSEGDKLQRILIIFALVLVLSLAFKLAFFKKITDIYLPLLLFVFFSTYCARVLNFYSLDIYDKILHFSSGILAGYIGIVIYDLLFINANDIRGRIAFAIFFAIAVAGLWEVWEFSCDKLLSMRLQRSLDDTMYDIICGSIGGIIISSIYGIIKKN